jgi:AcrR family transcriptional regulator
VAVSTFVSSGRTFYRQPWPASAVRDVEDPPVTSQRPRRRPGRPVGGSDAVGRIRESSLALFADRGYEATTIRSIAVRADVDAALVHHYFGTKRQLHAAVLDVPSDTAHTRHLIARIVADDMEGLLRDVATSWEHPATARVMRARLRHVVDNGPSDELYVVALVNLADPSLGAGTPGDEMPHSVSAVAAALLGMVVARYQLRIKPWATSTAEDLVHAWAPVLRAHAAAAGIR